MLSHSDTDLALRRFSLLGDSVTDLALSRFSLLSDSVTDLALNRFSLLGDSVTALALSRFSLLGDSLTQSLIWLSAGLACSANGNETSNPKEILTSAISWKSWVPTQIYTLLPMINKCAWCLLTSDLDLDQYVANHPFTGIGATVGGAQFPGSIGSWLLPEPI